MASTTIERFEYDHPRKTLSIWFVESGRRYDYTEVPPDVATAFNIATSKGRFFNERIRDHYPFEWNAFDKAEAPHPPPREPIGVNVIPFPLHRKRA